MRNFAAMGQAVARQLPSSQLGQQPNTVQVAPAYLLAKLADNTLLGGA